MQHPNPAKSQEINLLIERFKTYYSLLILLNMQIREMYDLHRHYEASPPRQYIHLRKVQSQLIPKPKKRQTFIANVQKLSKQIPGPGKYLQNPVSQKGKKLQIKQNSDYKRDHLKKSNNFLDEIIRKKTGIPGVGQYNPQIDRTEDIKKVMKIRNDKIRKEAPQFRPTCIEAINMDTQKIDPGVYSPRYKNIGSNSVKYSISPLSKAKTQSLPKLPGPTSYQTIPLSYETFAKKQSIRLNSTEQHTINQKNGFGSGKRAVLQKADGGPGPKYSLIAEWSPKAGKSPSNIFKSASKLPSESIYHP